MRYVGNFLRALDAGFLNIEINVSDGIQPSS